VSAMHILINSIWNKKVLPHEWLVFIIVSIHKNDDKSESNNYGGIYIYIYHSHEFHSTLYGTSFRVRFLTRW
jgi:hypothetical protein